ncbi:receptor-like protein EIX2 [Tanacetum coccineum]
MTIPHAIPTYKIVQQIDAADSVGHKLVERSKSKRASSPKDIQATGDVHWPCIRNSPDIPATDIHKPASAHNAGELPDFWMNFTRLLYLHLENNNFSRRIPISVGYLLNNMLSMRNNSLTGELPSSLKNWARLQFLDLGENNLLGRIPAWIWNSLSKSRVLSLPSNRFHGSMPTSICALSKMQILDISSNNFSGTIPRCHGTYAQIRISHKLAIKVRRIKCSSVIRAKLIRYDVLDIQFQNNNYITDFLGSLNNDAHPSSRAFIVMHYKAEFSQQYQSNKEIDSGTTEEIYGLAPFIFDGCTKGNKRNVRFSGVERGIGSLVMGIRHLKPFSSTSSYIIYLLLRGTNWSLSSSRSGSVTFESVDRPLIRIGGWRRLLPFQYQLTRSEKVNRNACNLREKRNKSLLRDPEWLGRVVHSVTRGCQSGLSLSKHSSALLQLSFQVMKVFAPNFEDRTDSDSYSLRRKTSHSQLVDQKFNSISAKSFSEDVCQLILRIDKVKFDHPILNMLLDKVKFDVYMHGSGMLNVVAAYGNSTFVITVHWNFIESKVIVGKL